MRRAGRPEAAPSSAVGRAASSRPRPGGSTSTPLWSTWPRPSGAEVIDGTAVVDVGGAAAARCRAGPSSWRTGGPATELRSSLRHRRRRHVVDGPQGARASAKPATSATGRPAAQYFSGVGPQARKLWVWFEPDMAPGYAWSFPLPGGTANVGYGVVRRPGAGPGPLRGQRIDLLSRPHIAAVLGPDASPIGPWKSWPIPARIGATALAGLGGRVLFAGDAARACDPMTGEGIAQALETAELAARADLVGRPVASGGGGRVDTAGRSGGAWPSMTAWPGPVEGAGPPAGTGGGACGSPTAAPGCAAHFARWMFEDYPRAVARHPAPLAAGTSSPAPGAFSPCRWVNSRRPISRSPPTAANCPRRPRELPSTAHG